MISPTERTPQEEEDGDRPPLSSLVEFAETTTTPGEMMHGTANIGSPSQEQSVEAALVMEFGLLRISENDTIPESARVMGQVAPPGVLHSSPSSISSTSSDLSVLSLL